MSSRKAGTRDPVMKILIKYDDNSKDKADWTTKKIKRVLKEFATFVRQGGSTGRSDWLWESSLYQELEKREAL